MAEYKNGKIELVGALYLAQMAVQFDDQEFANKLRKRVEKSISQNPDQEFVYIADILNETKRKRPEA
ncbi:MAG: hypothetical protein AAB656_03300 [Patescibacteria group bacterium]